jgi:hypothetical protein
MLPPAPQSAALDMLDRRMEPGNVGKRIFDQPINRDFGTMPLDVGQRWQRVYDVAQGRGFYDESAMRCMGCH